MVTIYRANEYVIQPDDKFLFDTNIWMYLHCSIGNYNADLVEEFSDLYSRIRDNENHIYTTSMLISEFLNTYSRLEFNLTRKSDYKLKNYKKDFRNNPEYEKVFRNINLVVEKKILNSSSKLNDSFEEFDKRFYFSNELNSDFNDEYFCFLAEKYGLKIVTNDKDFLKLDYDISIITQ